MGTWYIYDHKKSILTLDLLCTKNDNENYKYFISPLAHNKFNDKNYVY